MQTRTTVNSTLRELHSEPLRLLPGRPVSRRVEARPTRTDVVELPRAA